MSDKFNDVVAESGFYWPSFDVYRGKVEAGGFYDYGLLGVLLKRNIIEKWRRMFILPYLEFTYEVETPVIMPSIVFEASGHVEHFTDYLVTCSKCGRKYRADHLVEEELGKRGIKVKTEGLNEVELTGLIRRNNIRCPACGGELSDVQKFNLLFKTTIGPYSENVGYLRPETAQGMFVNFNRIYRIMGKLPMAIAQVGKVGRNEISPRQGLVRLREFSQMEIELFFDPQDSSCPYINDVNDVKLRLLTEEDVAKGVNEPRVVSAEEAVRMGYVANEWMAFYMALSVKFLKSLGVPEEKQMFIAKLPNERAHYARMVYDHVVYTERFGWLEVSGHAYRGDYDLSRHSSYSGQDISAVRRLKEPKVIEEHRVYPNPSRIREVYGNEAPLVLKALASVNPEELVRELTSKGEVVINGFKVTRDMVFIKTESRKVSTENFIPHVIEPSFGIDRILYVTLENAYALIDGRIVLKLPRDVAPITVAVLPIVSRGELIKVAKDIRINLINEGITAVYDDGGTIGARYAKWDSLGTPLAVTVDADTLKDNTVTVRDRDSRVQVRVKVQDLVSIIRELLRGKSINEVAVERNLQLIVRSQ
ncbi:glycine--tRNA ligase [Caldivirga maquilingensis]|uniref:glycine--tRNA ligase n=1 Tax=Caldivirga maquilingensis (strain ATCC 700844 / DSM 13496 / JCM 10307 / IC-167) TaxID=397948 RepID=A8MB92_CALMQ|nr:glycine--tRNA ligase [Caldivirga maquilingensis]ABW01182.1 glycyl-tRNA synthetase [Caldivirga maquilingensis IC-167]